jgi:hypothetical protein
MATIEEKVIKTLRQSQQPEEPITIVEKTKAAPNDVREAIRTLVDLGKVSITADWKIELKA